MKKILLLISVFLLFAAPKASDARLILSRYDAEEESFIFSVDKILQDTYKIHVPSADAPLFKAEFDSISPEAESAPQRPPRKPYP